MGVTWFASTAESVWAHVWQASQCSKRQE